MHREELLQGNIENLIAFWAACRMKDYSLHGGGILHSSLNWPRRMWFDYEYHPNRQDLEQLVGRWLEAFTPSPSGASTPSTADGPPLPRPVPPHAEPGSPR